MTWLQLSTVDIFATPTQGQVHAGVAFIMEQARHGHSVYVHCKAGRTRSATLVACYLIKVSPAHISHLYLEDSSTKKRFFWGYKLEDPHRSWALKAVTTKNILLLSVDENCIVTCTPARTCFRQVDV